MTAEFVEVPGFHYAQRVNFVGGEGIVQSRKHEAGTWTYLVEMPLGLEPACGRVGAETMVVFNEMDLWAA